MHAHSLPTQFLRFGVVGAVNTLIDFAVLNGLVLLFNRPVGIALLGCNAAGFVCANLNSYFANRSWTFPNQSSASLGQFSAFLSIAFIGLLINSALLWTLTGGSPTSLWHLNLAKAAASAVSMVWNFSGYRVLFGRR